MPDLGRPMPDEPVLDPDNPLTLHVAASFGFTRADLLALHTMRTPQPSGWTVNGVIHATRALPPSHQHFLIQLLHLLSQT
ncbi:hypothetical protein IWW46_000834 [Coemansia sp. RSA 2440]|nr:hypothetical protein IWW46_000834 [Coemansia sp. RSA 2440]